MLRVIASISLLAVASCQAVAQTSPGKSMPIWPATPLARKAPDEAERDTTQADVNRIAEKRMIRFGLDSQPELHVDRAQAWANRAPTSDTTVVIFPGGGYLHAWDLERTELAEWRQDIGATVVQVRDGVPVSGKDEKWLTPVQNIPRSFSLLRSGSVAGIAAKLIGMLGLSVGGNATTRTARVSKRYYDVIEAYDDSACTPDFATRVYPAWLVDSENKNGLCNVIQVAEKTAPVFFADASDDRATCISSATLSGKLKQHGNASQLHVFCSGGHGCGAHQAGRPGDAWPALCENRMKQQGWTE